MYGDRRFSTYRSYAFQSDGQTLLADTLGYGDTFPPDILVKRDSWIWLDEALEQNRQANFFTLQLVAEDIGGHLW